MPECSHCGDAGNIHTSEGFLACSCPAGEPWRKPMYSSFDKEKKYPRYLPVFRPAAGIQSSSGRDMRLKD